MRGMTSIEIAVIVAIVLIIAVAVGWYLYTTFVASTTGQPRINVVAAEYYTNGTLKLVIVNPGPVNVQLSSIEFAGTVQNDNTVIKVGNQTTIKKTYVGVSASAGTMLSGRVILSGGQSFPFNAIVKPS